ncbi:flagellar hook-length control protein FliK [Legionella dresdenensis]|uniref:Flagellar hook-length control protein FliK n=1 Tax=Legionella dresdenensis TaxID=450200 RepID=A0ABV8CBR1_9GAMM
MINLIQAAITKLTAENASVISGSDAEAAGTDALPFKGVMNKLLQEESGKEGENLLGTTTADEQLTLSGEENLVDEAIQLVSDQAGLATEDDGKDLELTPQESASLVWLMSHYEQQPVQQQSVAQVNTEQQQVIEELPAQTTVNPLLNKLNSKANSNTDADLTLSQNNSQASSLEEAVDAALPKTADAKAEILKEPVTQAAQKTVVENVVVADEIAMASADKGDKKLSLDTQTSSQPVVAAPTVNRQETAPVQASEPKKLEIPTNVSSRDWSDKFNQKIVWMGQQKIDSAVIKLNPQDLGPIEVKIHVNADNNAQLNITAHTHQVRDMIEQAIPRLKDMMNDQGVNLANVNVESNANQRQMASQQQESGNGGNNSQSAFQIGDDDHVLGETSLPKSGNGMIDYFA